MVSKRRVAVIGGREYTRAKALSEDQDPRPAPAVADTGLFGRGLPASMVATQLAISVVALRPAWRGCARHARADGESRGRVASLNRWRSSGRGGRRAST